MNYAKLKIHFLWMLCFCDLISNNNTQVLTPCERALKNGVYEEFKQAIDILMELEALRLVVKESYHQAQFKKTRYQGMNDKTFVELENEYHTNRMMWIAATDTIKAIIQRLKKEKPNIGFLVEEEYLAFRRSITKEFNLPAEFFVG